MRRPFSGEAPQHKRRPEAVDDRGGRAADGGSAGFARWAGDVVGSALARFRPISFHRRRVRTRPGAVAPADGDRCGAGTDVEKQAGATAELNWRSWADSRRWV